MDSSDHQRKGSNERRQLLLRRRLLRLIRGGWPSKSFGLHIYRRKFAARSSFLIRNDYGVWSQAHRRLIRMTRLGYWIVYDLDAKELRTWYEERLLRDRGMARWPEYGAGDREEVRSLIARVREEYWRRMPEHRRQKFVARLEEERRLKEESDQRQQLAAAADERRGAQMAAVDDGKLRASSRSSTQPPPRRRRRRRRWAPAAAAAAASPAWYSTVDTCCGNRAAVRLQIYASIVSLLLTLISQNLNLKIYFRFYDFFIVVYFTVFVFN
ncbi:hypothetical protein OsJ_00966 [Oryza sativa Japonica Group]|uniref:Uncharacterized protein n=1 Tax=Oryza sativa subsp. japonica TaxID=39947 RepID=A2ZQX2_ORYSJ|nr:hypothetical protein OsJ_00966 [Oryza sativa Japonica Group]